MAFKINLLFVFFFITAITTAQEAGKFIDARDNFEYSTVKIGEQVWTSGNLNTAFYSNGDSIPEAKNKNEWNKYRKEFIGCFCYYKYDSENGKKQGKFYNGYAITDPRGIAPEGWHIATQPEAYLLFKYLGEPAIANLKLKSDNWPDDPYVRKKKRVLINESGFSGQPDGYCLFGYFRDVQKTGMWWTSSDHLRKQLFYFSLTSGSDATIGGKGIVKGAGLPVRCIKDKK
jgi:uncharacterized protein (TIGR02145 family)